MSTKTPDSFLLPSEDCKRFPTLAPFKFSRQRFFGESGTATKLLKKYGLGPENIITAAERVLKKKR
jgi:hypothetical protein